MSSYQELLDLSQQFYAEFAIVFFRVGAMMAVMPAFGERFVPARVRLVVALAFSVAVFSAVSAELPKTLTLYVLVQYLITESAIGLILGLGLRLLVLALQTAGSIAAQSTSLSQLLGGASAEPLPAIGQILTTGALAFAVMSGLHIKVAQLLVLSYGALPAGVLPFAADISEWGVKQVAHAFSLAFSLAVPFVILSMLYNLTLGVINRAMPQLMVAFVGAPVITFGGVALLFLLTPNLMVLWASALDQYLSNPLGPRP